MPGQQWVAGLAKYNFDIKYRSGKSNIEADTLSRISWINKEPDIPKVQVNTLLVCKSLGTLAYPEYLPWKKTSTFVWDGVLRAWGMAQLLNTDWHKEQLDDPIIGQVHQWVE